MDGITDIAAALDQLNERFYREHAEAFSATRQGAWRGWDRALQAVAGCAGGAWPAQGARVLDVAAGNLRFERYLGGRYPEAALELHAVDRCPELLAGGGACARGDAAPAVRGEVGARRAEGGVTLHLLDVAASPELLPRGFDLVVCWGFLHHVFGGDARLRVLRALLDAASPGGFAAVSLWRFMDDPQIARRARAQHARALGRAGELGVDARRLEPGDWLLGWQDDSRAVRYCHSFGDDDADLLVAGVPQRCIARFEADGRNGRMNTYLVFRA